MHLCQIDLVCTIGLGSWLVPFVIAPRFSEPITTIAHDPDESEVPSETAFADLHTKGLADRQVFLPSFQRLPIISRNPDDNDNVSGSLQSILLKTYDQAEKLLPTFPIHSQSEHRPNDHPSTFPSLSPSSHGKLSHQGDNFYPSQGHVSNIFAYDSFPENYLTSRSSHHSPKRLRSTADNRLAEIGHAVQKDFSTSDPLSGLEGYSPWPSSTEELNPEQQTGVESVGGRRRKKSLSHARHESQHSVDSGQINHVQMIDRQGLQLASLPRHSPLFRQLEQLSSPYNQLQNKHESKARSSFVVPTPRLFENAPRAFPSHNQNDHDMYPNVHSSTRPTSTPSYRAEAPRYTDYYSHKEPLVSQSVDEDFQILQPFSGHVGEDLSGLTSEEVLAESPQHDNEDLTTRQLYPYFREEVPHTWPDRRFSTSQQQRPPNNVGDHSASSRTYFESSQEPLSNPPLEAQDKTLEVIQSTQKSANPAPQNTIHPYYIISQRPRIPETQYSKLADKLVAEIVSLLPVPDNRDFSLAVRELSIGNLLVQYIPLKPDTYYPRAHGYMHLMQTRRFSASGRIIKQKIQWLLNCLFYYHEAWLKEIRESDENKAQEDLYNWLREIVFFPQDSFPVFGYSLPRTSSDQDAFGKAQQLIISYLLTRDIKAHSMRDPTAIGLIYLRSKEKPGWNTFDFCDEAEFEKKLVEAIPAFDEQHKRRKELDIMERSMPKEPEISVPMTHILDTSAGALGAPKEKAIS